MTATLQRLALITFLATTSPAVASEWTIRPSNDGSEPVARHEAGFVGVGDLGVLLGGRRRTPVNLFDPTSGNWKSGAQPPVELHHIQPVVRNGRVIVVGAMTGPYPNEFAVPYAMVYDPAADKWSRGFDLPPARLRGSTGNVLVGNNLYVACGLRDGHRGEHKDWFDVYDFTTKTWSILPPAPRPRDHFTAAAIGGKIYLLGGRRSNAPNNTFGDLEPLVDVYDIQSQTWSTLTEPLPTPRAGHAVAVVGNEILVIGGESMSQKPAHAEVEALDAVTGKWRRHSLLQRGRHGSGVAQIGSSLVIASGSGGRGGGPELTSTETFLLPSAPR